MAILTSKTLKKYQNEIRDLKAVQPINGGSLTQHALTATWEGNINKNQPISQYSLLAAFKATFTRTDGVNIPPLVQFAFNTSPSTSESNGECGAVVTSFTDNSISYRIILYNYWWPFSSSQTVGHVIITCKAYSPVAGTLTLERVYS